MEQVCTNAVDKQSNVVKKRIKKVMTAYLEHEQGNSGQRHKLLYKIQTDVT